MAAAVRKAQAMPSALNNVLTKRLNRWVNADNAWMPIEDWKRCGNAGLQLDDFSGERAWIGMDTAEKRDFAALALVFKRDDRFFLFTRLYLNELAISESGNAHLQGWARAGYVKVTDGNATDFDVIADDLRNFCKQFDVQEIPYDPAMSRYFATKLAEEGLPLVEIRRAPMFFTSR